MTNDTIYFLILWLIAMFVTLTSGIVVIMYQVRCFPCQNNEVGAELTAMHHGGHADFHTTHLDPKHARTCVVCGEALSTEEDGDYHQSCHDVDVILATYVYTQLGSIGPEISTVFFPTFKDKRFYLQTLSQ